jgi:hypothetical protein
MDTCHGPLSCEADGSRRIGVRTQKAWELCEAPRTEGIDCLMMSTASKKTELPGVTQLLQVQASGLGIHRSPRGLYGMFHPMQRLGLGYVVTDDGGELGKNRLYSIDKIQVFRQYPLVEGPAAGLWTNGATHSPPLRYQPEKLHQSPSP